MLLRKSPKARGLGYGLVIAVATSVAAVLASWVFGPPFAGWSWREPAIGLLALEASALTVVAVLTVPFEPRLRRWSQPHDPLAIGYQLDLSATELNAPARQMIDSRWLWIALPPLLVAFVLGAWLLLTTAAPDNRPPMILEDSAIRAAQQVVEQAPPGSERVVVQRVELTTYALARDFIAERATIIAAPPDPNTLVYDVWFGPSSSAVNPKDDPFAGPHVVVNAETGVVMMTSGLP